MGRLEDWLDKARRARGRPLLLKRGVLSVLISGLDRAYSGAHYVLDRLLSFVLVIAYDWLRFSGSRAPDHDVEYMLCSYKYSDISADQESIEKFALEDTLLNYVGDPERVSLFHWDFERPFVGFGFQFYRKVLQRNPRTLVLSSYSPRVFFQPMPWILKRLKNGSQRKDMRIIALWWDTCSDGFAPKVEPVIDLVDVHGIMENPTLQLGPSPAASRLRQKARPLFAAYDLKIENVTRDLDVAFMGQISDYRGDRKRFLDHLLDQGIRIHYSAFDKSLQCTNEKYFEILSRAKIGINFSRSVDKHQLKARVFEIMHCGSLLLEECNEQTACYFQAGVEYATFSTETELVEKIRYYLANEDERRTIAEAGQRKVRQLYTGKQFWERLQ